MRSSASVNLFTLTAISAPFIQAGTTTESIKRSLLPISGKSSVLPIHGEVALPHAVGKYRRLRRGWGRAGGARTHHAPPHYGKVSTTPPALPIHGEVSGEAGRRGSYAPLRLRRPSCPDERGTVRLLLGGRCILDSDRMPQRSGLSGVRADRLDLEALEQLHQRRAIVDALEHGDDLGARGKRHSDHEHAARLEHSKHLTHCL